MIAMIAVFGESIQNVFRYTSTTITLGERQYVLPVVVLHCVEEVYRTGLFTFSDKFCTSLNLDDRDLPAKLVSHFAQSTSVARAHIHI